MTHLVVKEFEEFHNQFFIKATHLKSKELIVQHYSDIFDLSENGFRLFEKYTKMYNWEFITNFYAIGC